MQDDELGYDFGQVAPPVVDIIRDILQRYPEGGQILKELIQNADDAGATEVQFLLDHRQNAYGAERLVLKCLSEFQGPALYAQNNAKFSADDWKGIQTIYRSVKKNDPLKVGKFGIGFNSIYHLTDLPSIVSGEYVAFLDPLETHFGRGKPGRKFAVRKEGQEPRFADQFSPFNVLGCNIRKMHYNGTLFRFPLRNSPSDLCKNICTPDRVCDLFESFKADAHLVLLFLKSVEEITLYEWLPEMPKPQVVYRVQLSEDTKDKVRQQRQEFLQQVKEHTESLGQLKNDLCLETMLKCGVTTEGKHTAPTTQHWLVLNYVNTENSDVTSMGKTLCQIPWVGLALPVGQKTEHCSSPGRIFCFLPLPPSDDGDSNAGLPVHVHGSFSVADNRRNLTWPAQDRKKDDKVVWNCLLLEHLVAPAYVSLILKARDLFSSSSEIRLEDVYGAWPDFRKVQCHWKEEMIPAFLKFLSAHRVLWSKSSGGQWLSANGSVISCQTSESRSAEVDATVDEMIDIGRPLVCISEQVLECLQKMVDLTGIALTEMSPRYARNTLKKRFEYKKRSQQHKLLLLRYVLSDEKYEYLQGLELLPLANGSMTGFGTAPNAHPTVFVATHDCPRSLFPSLGNRFVADAIDDDLQHHLRKIASHKCLQLRVVTVSDVPQLVRQMLAPLDQPTARDIIEWQPGQKGHPSEKWIEDLWMWINGHIDEIHVDSFKSHILPCVAGSEKKMLARLVPGLPLIITQLKGGKVALTKTLQQTLRSLGCYTVDGCLKWIPSQQYALSPSQVVTCLARAAPSNYEPIGIEQKQELRDVIALTIDINQPSPYECEVLSRLPVFRRYNDGFLTSVDGCPAVAPSELAPDLPLGLNMLATPTANEERIISWMPVERVQRPSFVNVCMAVFARFDSYSDKDKETLGLYVLDNVRLLKGDARESVRHLKFVSTEDGSLKSPEHLFDPSDCTATALLQGKPVFPSRGFMEDKHRTTAIRRDVGLRSLESISAMEFLQIAQDIGETRDHHKAKVLLKVFIQHKWARSRLQEYVLASEVRIPLKSALCKVRWLPVMVKPSVEYPYRLRWFGGSSNPWARVNEVIAATLAFPIKTLQSVVGSQAPLLDYCDSPYEVSTSLGFRQANFTLVVGHLKEGWRLWRETLRHEPNITKQQFDAMMRQVLDCLCRGWKKADKQEEIRQALRAWERETQQRSNWVWLNISQGFVYPNQLVSRSAFEASLEPWLYTVDSHTHLSQCIEFLSAFGLKREFHLNDVLSILGQVKSKHDGTTHLGKSEVKKDLELTFRLLNWVAKQENAVSTAELLIPVCKGRETKLELCPREEVVYCDPVTLVNVRREELAGKKLSHSGISYDMARTLGIRSLTSHIASSEEFGFEELGQHEPLTRRLGNILNEYPDDSGIFKELIQNADDAGAKEVCFLIDWRRHPCSTLLSPGMEQCQGPALWAYNDAVFTEEDFQNIAKLAARTKETKLDKIGQFGLGFTSVYHMTEVPSFVSGNNVVFFDPHTTHLGDHIRNKSRPGIIIDFVKTQVATCAQFRDQFSPYENVFGCNLDSDRTFDGTLFRFPFRTEEQARKSEIKREAYDRTNVCQAIQSLKSVSCELLLFLNHVETVRLFELKERALDPAVMKQLLAIDLEQLDTKLSSSSYIPRSKLLEKCKDAVLTRSSPSASSTAASLVKIDVSDERELLSTRAWLRCACIGPRRVNDIAQSEDGRKRGCMPFAETAVEVRWTDNSWMPFPTEGQVFCFLPLSQRSGLCFHVNGVFAVSSNRRGLVWLDPHLDRHNSDKFQQDWNNRLVGTTLVVACFEMLKVFRCLCGQDNIASRAFEIWPNQDCMLSPVWREFASRFYNRAFQTGSDVMCTANCTRWLHVEEAVFLADSAQWLPHSQTLMSELYSDYVQVPGFVETALFSCDEYTMRKRTVDDVTLIQQVFGEETKKFDQDVKFDLAKKLLRKVLDPDCLRLWPVLRNLAFVPVSAMESCFRSPSDLIHPDSIAAKCFAPKEGRFPSSRLRENLQLSALLDLGMKGDNNFTWDDCIERAANVESVCLSSVSSDECVHPAKSVLRLMEHVDTNSQIAASQRHRLQNVAFLPVMTRRPKYYPRGLVWYGSDRTPPVASAVTLFHEKCKTLVGSRQLVLHSDITSRVVSKVLHVSSKPPPKTVVEQLLVAVEFCCQHADDSHIGKMIVDILLAIGKYEEDGGLPIDDFLASMGDRPWILVDHHLVKPCQLAFNWKLKVPPHLFQVPSELHKIKSFLLKSGVRESFTERDFVKLLRQIFEDLQGKRLPEGALQCVQTILLGEINDWSKAVRMQLREENEVPLPCKQNKLLLASHLVYDDIPWIQKSSQKRGIYVHDCIPRSLAVDLGVKPVREHVLQSFSSSVSWHEFGQRESLAQRLNSILEGYPFGEAILKELLQNADDAGASELRIIYDKRVHKRRRVLSDSWAELQGPALCVFNNKPFSQEDIEGIQHLGIGSKQEAASLTGQYGIGFNAVYHLTDCPSFLSNAEKLGFMDPHCKYVPSANERSPGGLFDVDDEFWRMFPDLSDCYRSFEHLQLKGGTLFRLPLRSKEMAKKSEISRKFVDDGDINKLLAEFRQSARDMLLFLRYVRVLTLEVIDERGRLTEWYEFKARISNPRASEQERLRLDGAIAAAKTHRQSVLPVPYHSVSYTMTIAEDDESREEWLIFRCLSTPNVEGQKEITVKRKFKMLPVVGIASPINRNLLVSEGKLYCFLPLPSRSRLPVHINGHFALDPERRGLWIDGQTEKASDKQAWNDVLIRCVMAPAYAQFLVAARTFVSVSRGGTVATSKLFEQRLKWFQALIPIPSRVEGSDEHFDVLSKETLSCIVRQELPLLPLVGELLPSELSLIGSHVVGKFDVNRLKWLQVCRRRSLALNDTAIAYVCSSQSVKLEIKSLLLRVGMPIVATPDNVYEGLKAGNDDLDMELVTPEEVLKFLLKYRYSGSACKLKLGDISSTALQSVDNVKSLLEYVTPRLATSMHGLPLLVTEDNRLREFSDQSPVYVTRFSGLFASMPSGFVKEELVQTLFEFRTSSVRVLRCLTPRAIVDLLRTTPIFVSYPLRSVVEWDKASPTVEWIGLLWQYIGAESGINNSLDELRDWPIIPSQTGLLVPPCLAHTVFHFDTRSQELYPELIGVLKTLGGLEVDLTLIADAIETVDELLLDRLASLLKPHSLLKAVCALFKDLSATVSVGDANCLLEYFEHTVSSLDGSRGLFDEIKSLPLFESVDGTLSTIPVRYKGYCLRDIPSAGCTIWRQRWKCIFLREKPRLKKLYELLGFSKEVFHKAYVQHILPCFGSMTQDDRLTHMVSIERETRVTNLCEVVELLKDTPCFDNSDGIARLVSDFFDPTVALFAKILSKERFPPFPCGTVSSRDKTYRKQWLDFLVKLGLQRRCPLDGFETLAKLLEEEAESLGVLLTSNAAWKEKSKLLVEHLSWNLRASWRDTTFMARIAALKFLPQRKISDRLCKLAKPLCDRSSRCLATSFSEAIDPCEGNELLCWTVQSLLPDISIADSHRKEFFAAVGIKAEPGLVSVLDHYVTLISEAQTVISTNRSGQQDLVLTLTEVLGEMCKYLQDFFPADAVPQLPLTADLRDSATLLSVGGNKDCHLIVCSLYDKQCVFIKDKQMFVKPRQLVFGLEPELHPYLLQLPRELAEFYRLFKCLGVDELPRPFHYARVLESIAERPTFADQPLNETVGMLAVTGLFRALQKSPVKTGDCSADQSNPHELALGDTELKSALTPLYLPSRNQKMILSAKLVYLDRPSFVKYVEDLPYEFLVDLNSECDLSSLAEDTVDLLPAALRPKNLSDLACESLDPTCRVYVNNSEEEDTATKYREHLSSPYFVQGVRSIYITFSKTSKIPQCVKRGLDVLRNQLDVVCLAEVRTVLETKGGDALRLHRDVRHCFMQVNENGAKLYLSKDTALWHSGFTLVGSIALEVERLLKVQLPEYALMTILRSEVPSDIPRLLEDLNIRYHASGEETQEKLPRRDLIRPGMTVLPEHRLLLQLAPTGYRFNVDDWVAYERDEEHFVYARMAHRDYTQQETEGNHWLTRYFIDIGNEDPISVDVLSLYKFGEVNGQSAVADVVLSSDTTERTEIAPDQASLEEKIRMVRSQLKEIWNLPEAAKKQAIKRLYLQWHPDKCDDLDSEEVFKAIRAEIERLESGNADEFGGAGSSFFSSPRSGSRSGRRGGRQASGRSYSSSFDNWNSFARTFERPRSQSSTFDTSGFGPQTFRRTAFFPQATSFPATCDQSCGWMFVEQAEADLRVAEHLFKATSDGPFHAAVCFHCHEVVEKALKGALFLKVGIRPERQRRHNISFFLHVSELAGCPRTLVSNARKIREDDYLDTRYPDRNGVVPAKSYTRGQAELSMEGARGVMKDIQQLVGK